MTAAVVEADDADPGRTAITASTDADARFDWRWRSFDELTVHELDAIYRVRQRVFVVEQRCAFVDADGADPASFHLAAWPRSGADAPLAYARVVAPGVRDPEPSIGRVLTVGAGRGVGLGRLLLGRSIAACRASFPGMAIRISAQARLEAFYAAAGFASTGDAYLEDAIPHIAMRLSA